LLTTGSLLSITPKAQTTLTALQEAIRSSVCVTPPADLILTKDDYPRRTVTNQLTSIEDRVESASIPPARQFLAIDSRVDVCLTPSADQNTVTSNLRPTAPVPLFDPFPNDFSCLGTFVALNDSMDLLDSTETDPPRIMPNILTRRKQVERPLKLNQEIVRARPFEQTNNLSVYPQNIKLNGKSVTALCLYIHKL
jgi:hypothetical protein